jgi:hypothetical protein
MALLLTVLQTRRADASGAGRDARQPRCARRPRGAPGRPAGGGRQRILAQDQAEVSGCRRRPSGRAGWVSAAGRWNGLLPHLRPAEVRDIAGACGRPPPRAARPLGSGDPRWHRLIPGSRAEPRALASSQPRTYGLTTECKAADRLPLNPAGSESARAACRLPGGSPSLACSPCRLAATRYSTPAVRLVISLVLLAHTEITLGPGFRAAPLTQRS